MTGVELALVVIGCVGYVLGGVGTCYMLGRSLSGDGTVDGAQALLFFIAWPLFLPIASIGFGANRKVRASDEPEGRLA